MGLHAEIWMSMALFAFVSSVTPGPNNLMLLSSGVNFGVRATLPHMLGISCGHFVMLMAVGLGLGELLLRMPSIYQAMKVLAITYMLYLAWGIAKSAAPQNQSGDMAGAKPLGFMGAAAFQWVNPKAWVMTLGYFGAYMPQDADVTLIALASLVFSLINVPCIAAWAVMGSRMRHYFEVDLYRRMFNWTMAILLVASMATGLLMR